MSVITRSRVVAFAVTGGLALASVGTASPALAASPSARAAHVASLPQSTAARRAATWLAKQLNAHGVVVTSGSPDLSDTAQIVLALAATGTQMPAEHRALDYLEGHVNAYVKDAGHDGPGQLANLILVAHAVGARPTSFGGTNLVRRLERTIATSGANTGLFGAQDPTYDGAYRQGLALAALAAAGVRSASVLDPAVRWLDRQQCANGAWASYRPATSVPCPPSDPTTYSGPDTNSTALAVEGLEAVKARLHHSPLGVLRTLEATTAGWGYYGGAADPDSTALVLQALLALRVSVTQASLTKGGADPVNELLSFRLPSGAFFYPGSTAANLIATEQVVPALMKRAIPF